MAMLDMVKALKELQEKSLQDIEKSTALTWGGRALASYHLSRESATPAERLQRFCDGEGFRQEALEHASMCEDGGALLHAIQHEIETGRWPAIEALRRVLDPR